MEKPTISEVLAEFQLKDNFLFLESKAISRFAMEKYLNGEVDRVTVFVQDHLRVLGVVDAALAEALPRWAPHRHLAAPGYSTTSRLGQPAIQTGRPESTGNVWAAAVAARKSAPPRRPHVFPRQRFRRPARRRSPRTAHEPAAWPGVASQWRIGFTRHLLAVCAGISLPGRVDSVCADFATSNWPRIRASTRLCVRASRPKQFSCLTPSRPV